MYSSGFWRYGKFQHLSMSQNLELHLIVPLSFLLIIFRKLSFLQDYKLEVINKEIQKA
jgi:hypothetical protein